MANTTKIWTIIQHEYITKVKTKGFIIGTLLAPLGIILFFAVIGFVAYLSIESTGKKIAVLDKTNHMGKILVQSDTAKFSLTTKTENELKKATFDEKIDGYLVIPKDIIDKSIAYVYTRGGGGLALIEHIESSLGRITRIERLKQKGLGEDVIRLVNKNVKIETKKVTEKGVQQDYTEAFAVIGYILGFAIYIFMFIYGSFVSRAVIEEKANRIIEVIASSAKPFEILMGKVIGIGFVGLTQILSWIILFIGVVYLAQPIVMHFMANPEMMSKGMMTAQQQEIQSNFMMIKDFISGGVLFAFVFYFLSGYFIFSTMFAAVGSAVDQEQDAQQLMTPISMLIIIPMLFITVIMQNPDSTVSIVLSLIPYFAPILMIVRIASTDVPLWQILSSVILIIITFIFSVWIASKIYRVGILMYGKKPKIKDLIKWIKLS